VWLQESISPVPGQDAGISIVKLGIEVPPLIIAVAAMRMESIIAVPVPGHRLLVHSGASSLLESDQI
jgi:hypothetical protein